MTPPTDTAARLRRAASPLDEGGTTSTSPAERLRQAILEDRRRTISEIRSFNPTADSRFLAEFRTSALKDYLEHLRHARHKNVRLAGWLQKRTAARLANRRVAA